MVMGETGIRLVVEGWLPCDLPLILSSMVDYGMYSVVWSGEDVLLLLAGDMDQVG